MEITSSAVVHMKRHDEIVMAGVRKAVLQRLGVLAIGIIQRRTEAGRDVNGKAFAPYSKGYAKQRAGSGRGTNVSLHLSGAMFGSMKVLTVDDKRVLIGFEGSAPAYQFVRTRTKSGKLSGGKRSHRLAASTGGQVVANALKAYWNDRGGKTRRHFFGISDEEKKLLVAEALKALRIRRRR